MFGGMAATGRLSTRNVARGTEGLRRGVMVAAKQDPMADMTRPEPPYSAQAARAAPGVQAFGLLAGIEALTRGTLLSVFPLVMYRAFQDAQVVSSFYFLVGILSLCTGLMVPLLTRFVPRRWVYTLGCSFYLFSSVCGMIGGTLTAGALLANAMAAATVFVCFNAYVLDNVAKADLRKLETLRLLYGGIGWSAGPVTGVWLLQVWPGAPFVISGAAAAVMLAAFWAFRMGDGRVITRAKAASPNPFIYLRRFFAQPRLVAGWFFAVTRSCGWWVFIVYVSIFAVDRGLGDQVGGMATSAANLGLFIAPLMLAWMRKRTVRRALRAGFAFSGLCFLVAWAVAPMPWATVGVLMVGAYGLVWLDICGGLPFLMSVKPSERTEMSAVYSSFRDVSGIVTPGVAWVVLTFAPVEAVFAVMGVAMFVARAVAGRLHPDLGVAGADRMRGLEQRAI